jgi:hypothetical protein
MDGGVGLSLIPKRALMWRMSLSIEDANEHHSHLSIILWSSTAHIVQAYLTLIPLT